MKSLIAAILIMVCFGANAQWGRSTNSYYPQATNISTTSFIGINYGGLNSYNMSGTNLFGFINTITPDPFATSSNLVSATNVLAALIATKQTTNAALDALALNNAGSITNVGTNAFSAAAWAYIQSLASGSGLTNNSSYAWTNNAGFYGNGIGFTNIPMSAFTNGTTGTAGSAVVLSNGPVINAPKVTGVQTNTGSIRLESGAAGTSFVTFRNTAGVGDLGIIAGAGGYANMGLFFNGVGGTYITIVETTPGVGSINGVTIGNRDNSALIAGAGGAALFVTNGQNQANSLVVGTTNSARSFAVSQSGNVFVGNTITATNGVALIQTATVPTNSIPAGGNNGLLVNFTNANYAGPTWLRTNTAGAGLFLTNPIVLGDASGKINSNQVDAATVAAFTAGGGDGIPTDSGAGTNTTFYGTLTLNTTNVATSGGLSFGTGNTVTGDRSFGVGESIDVVSGAKWNFAGGIIQSVLGTSAANLVYGGEHIIQDSDYSTVGGYQNKLTNSSSSLVVGNNNVSFGFGNTVLGNQAVSTNANTFIWSDGDVFSSTTNRQVSFNALNGYRFLGGTLAADSISTPLFTADTLSVNSLTATNFSSSSGYGSLATNQTVVASATGLTNTLTVNYVAYLTAATSLSLTNAGGAVEFSGVTVAAFTPIRVQPGGKLIGTSITYATGNGGNAW